MVQEIKRFCIIDVYKRQIYDMVAPLSVHQLLASKIDRSLVGYIEKNQGACIPMFAPVDVQLDQDDKTMVQPDLMIVCDRKKLTRCV